MTVTRRRFIHLLGSSTLAVVAGCTREESLVSTSTSTLDPGASSRAPGADLFADAPFSVWEDVLEAVRSSPDHLVAQADRLVAAADPERLFEFVRDSIRTVPPRADGFRDAVSSVRSGTRSVLRTGAGTPREKAEVLAELLGRAGFEAKVVQGVPVADLDARSAVLRSAPAQFAPDISDERSRAWFDALGVAPPTELPRLDPDGGESAGIAGAVLSALSVVPSAAPFDWTVTEMPLVEIAVGGRTVYANPFLRDAIWAEPYASSIINSPPVISTASVGVKLQVAMSADPSVRHTLVEGSWPVEVVSGRRLMARFVPEGDPAAVLATPPARLMAHTALLVVDGPGLDFEADPSLLVTGATVTTSGSVLEVVDDRLVADGSEFGADPSVVSQVATMSAEASGNAFPLVRLKVSPLDGNGAPVAGLPAEALTIREGGVPTPFMMTRTRPADPAVLVVFDTSGSIPEDFRGDGAAAFAAKLISDILATHPSAKFRFGGVASGSLAVSPTTITDPAAADAEARRVVGFGSDVWSALSQARFTPSTLVVLVSDGRLTDSPDAIEAARSWIASGPPVVAIGVGDVERPSLDEIAALSGGAVFSVAEHQEATSAVRAFLAEQDSAPIEILYTSAEDGPATREVTVSATSAEASATYEVPAAIDRLEPPGLAGIYIVVSLGGQEVVRTIAGVPHESAVRTAVVGPDLRKDVHAALFGSVLLSVEAGAPTYAAWLDDALTTRRSWRAMIEASRNGESGVAAAIESRLQVVPGELPLLHASLDYDEGAATFEIGPRLVLLVHRPLWDGGVVKRADILPFTRFVTVGPDPQEAFRANVERTARLAVAERMLYEDSTAQRLSGRQLSILEPFAAASRSGANERHAPVLDRFAAWHRFLPEDAGPFAFWAIDPNGSVIGVLPDGSGGGSTASSANEQCKNVGQAAGAVDLVGPAVGLPFAWGAFVALGKAIAKQAIREAAIIASLGGPMPDTSECGAPGDFPCDVAKSAVYEAIPYGQYVAAYDAATAAATGKDAFDC